VVASGLLTSVIGLRRLKWVCLLAAFSSTRSADADKPGPLLAGAASIDITPPAGIPMWGYGARHALKAEGTHEPLKATALVLFAGGKGIAIVATDYGRGPTREISARLREAVRKDGVEALFVTGSHTHHGPVLEVCDHYPSKEKPWAPEYEKRLLEVIKQAVTRRKPARYLTAVKPTTLSRNRQSKLPIKNVDRDVRVLRVECLDGSPIATAVNFAAHPVILPGAMLKWAPDFPGALRERVSKELGGECLFLQGASGDLSPNRGDLKTDREFGEAVAAEAIAAIKAREAAPASSPSTPPAPAGVTTGTNKPASAKTSPKPTGSTLAVSDEEIPFQGLRVDPASPMVRAAYGLAFFPELADFYAKDCPGVVRTRLTVAVLDGRIGFVGGTGEFFCAHAIRLRERARLDELFFLGYCNDHHLYFPTIEAAAEGGYGADPGVSLVPIGAGETLMNRALERLFELRKPFKKGLL
jgi:hypothetical protein